MIGIDALSVHEFRLRTRGDLSIAVYVNSRARAVYPTVLTFFRIAWPARIDRSGWQRDDVVWLAGVGDARPLA